MYRTLLYYCSLLQCVGLGCDRADGRICSSIYRDQPTVIVCVSYWTRSTLVFEKVAKDDIGGALENLENCREVFERYPGLCRFTMG